MTNNNYARLIAPGSTFAVGTAIAIAVRIGHTWTEAIVTEVITVLVAFGYYLLAGSKSDVGAIYGQRKDERQRLMVLKASRLAMIVMFSLTFVIALIMVASNKTYWQEDVIGSVGGVSFLLGILAYGTHDEDAMGGEGTTAPGDSAMDADESRRVIPPM
jgi:hypothetical protein